MSPDYNDGDYVIISRFPLLFNSVKTDSVLVFNSQKYGIMIKKVSAVDPAQKKFFFRGISSKSITSQKIGAIDKKDILGKVLFHIKK